MTTKEREILSTFEQVIPAMSEIEKEKLLSFGEGISFKTQEIREQQELCTTGKVQ